MREFTYKASNASGAVSSGSLAALDERQAAALLQRQGLIPLRIVASDGVDKVLSPVAKASSFKPQRKSLTGSGE